MRASERQASLRTELLLGDNTDAMSERMLSETEAFKAARYFIKQFNEREKSDALSLVVHWMGPDDGDPTRTNDPAQWHDWVSSVDRVIAERAP